MKRTNQMMLALLAGTAAMGVAGIGAAQTAPQTAPTSQQAPTDPAAAQQTPASPAPVGQTATPAAGQTASTTPTNPSVGGAPMLPSKTIVENAETASNLSTLVEAVKAAGLEQTLSQPGPYTVFAPTNDAFKRLAPGTVATLMKPENKATLTKVLNYHVVPGAVTIEDLQARAQAGGGKVTLTTVEGDPLIVTVEGQMITLTDVNGNKSYVETGDVRQANGVVHVVNGVVLPKLG